MTFHKEQLVVAFVALLLFSSIYGHPAPVDGAFDSRVAEPGPTFDCTLRTNPDISGIGVRVAFYIQGILTIFGPLLLDSAEAESTLQNAFLTTVALSITGFISAAQPGMASVIDGVLITFLPNVITFGARNHLPTFVNAKRSVKISGALYILFASIFGIYFWVNVNTFGTSPGCQVNSTAQFVLFGQSVGMTSKGLKKFGISIFSLTIVAGLYVAVMLLPSLAADPSKRQTDWKWAVFPLAGWIYGVTTIEQILQRNKLGQDANVWTFGQTLAIALLITPAYDLTVAIWRRVITKRGSGLPQVGTEIGISDQVEDKERENTATA